MWRRGHRVLSAALGLVGCFAASEPEVGRDATADRDAPVECPAVAPPADCFTVSCGRCWLVCYDVASHAAAVETCTAWGGGAHLAQPQDEAARTCLGDSITSFGWVDLNQAAGSSTADAGWAWGDGTTFSGPWAEAEPDDSGGAPDDSGVEQCGALAAGTGLPLDIACNSGLAQTICAQD